MARVRDPPHGHGEGGGVVVVEGAKELLDGGGRDVGLVEGHLMEEVVGDVCGADLVVEVVEYPVGPVDGAQRAPNPGPLVLPILRHAGVVVLEPSVQDEPGVRPHVRAPVVKGDGEEAVVEGQLREEAEHA